MVTFLIMSLPLISVMMTAGGEGQQLWTLNRGPSYVCALKGSTVNLSCVLNSPHDHELSTVFWTKTAVADGETSNLCLDPENRGRVQCFSGDKDTHFLTLSSVREADKHIYYCRLTTNRGTWTGFPGAQLDVTDLQVETEQTVKETDPVTLRCKSSCSLPRTSFIWFRNTERFTTGIISENQLHLQSVRRDDSGNYQCAVSGYEHLISPPVYLKVQWDDGLEDWGVNYSPSYVCALKGSTVKLSCTVKYPQDHQLKTVLWTKPAVGVVDLPDLCSDPKKRGRVECVREDKDTSSITLTSLTEADKHIYYCRFTTNTEGGRWTGVPGAQLDVTDLQVETEQTVKETDPVTLRCKSSCSLPQTSFIWFRNTERFTTGIISENQLQLQSVSRLHSGSYQCAVSGYELLISPPVYLNVEYPPRSVRVSVSPSAEVVEGDSVTLICSSDSNPPALNFSWFKENQSSAVGSEQSLIISSFNSRLSGLYYCEAQNQHGFLRSASVSVSVKGVQRVVHILTGIVVGCGALIFIIIVFIMKTRRNGGSRVGTQNQEDGGVGRSAKTSPTNDDQVCSLESANQRDDLYANIKAKKPKHRGREQTEKDSRDAEEIQYASVHHFKNKDMKTKETIEMQHLPDASRSEDVIYSSVK
ncbi:B-cell receptor CD22-like [Puntigrus tetrazona]|uniref:B-cell receptor CD22-like n=1 Tax=Puntigrus tetrazona TaxID=1606681 RepID=UPI001C8AEFEA|nr:B-cell receptor CD22-like [Puntigrus tetrazona]